MRKHLEKFNWITDYAKRLDFWSGGELSGIISGPSSKMTDFIPNIVGTLLFSFGILCGIIGIFNTFRQREKNKYISLQEAAEVLSDSVKNILSREWIDSVTPINRSDPFDEFEYKRSNPDKIHKETLPKITIGLINLTLHICKKNNVKVYGKRPSFSDRIMIPFEEIQFFSADRTRLYSDRSRDAATLIYSDVAVMKKDFEYAINNTDDAEFGQIVYAL